MNKRTLKNRCLRIAASIFAISFCVSIASILCNHPYDNAEKTVNSFYNQSDKKLDYIFIGASSVVYNVNPTIIYHESGLMGCCLSIDAAAGGVYVSMLDEVKNKYEDVVLLVDAEGLVFDNEINIKNSNRIWIDTMEKNKNWLNSICRLDYSNRLEHYIPILRYHSNLPRFYAYLPQIKQDYINKKNKTADIMHGANVMTKRITEIHPNETYHFFVPEDLEESQPSKNVEENINEFIELCNQSNFKDVIFIDSPKICFDSEHIKELNRTYSLLLYLKRIVRENGYTFLESSGIETINECDIDISDYADTTHLNVYGAKKLSCFYADFLISNYKFEQKNELAIEKWNADAFEMYKRYDL